MSELCSCYQWPAANPTRLQYPLSPVFLPGTASNELGSCFPQPAPGDSTDAQLCSALPGLVQTQWVLIRTPSLRVCCRVIQPQPPVGEGGFIHEDMGCFSNTGLCLCRHLLNMRDVWFKDFHSTQSYLKTAEC